jgi:hypothetical protein
MISLIGRDPVTRLVQGVAGVLFIALVVWIARNTYWAEVAVPLPLKGEAITNPFYAAQRFTESLGGSSVRDRMWTSPSPEAVVVLSSWHWDLNAGRRQAIERWVEAGGRLVVDRTLAGSLDTFEGWSGIEREFDVKRFGNKRKQTAETDPDVEDFIETGFGKVTCDRFTEERHGEVSAGEGHRLCTSEDFQFLTSTQQPEWALRNERGAQAMRLRVGRGSVTVINATPFSYRELFDGDHARLFVAAAQFHRGDEIRFLSEDDYPSLLALLWQNAGPAVVLMLVIVVLLLWRGWVRFGPMAPPLPSARRSLAEQIRGSGEFALRYGSGESLHAAVVRALTEAVSRRVPGYPRLPPQEQTAALARLAGMDSGSLAAALHHLAARREERLRNALALLETARRRALTQHPRSSDGTD